MQLKNNERSTYRYLFYPSSFMRYNECPVLILSCLITCTGDAKNDHIASQGESVNVLSWIRLHSGWFLMFNKFVEILFNCKPQYSHK